MLQLTIKNVSAAEILKNSRADINSNSWSMNDTVRSHFDIINDQINEEMNILVARHSASFKSHDFNDDESLSDYRECVFTQ